MHSPHLLVLILNSTNQILFSTFHRTLLHIQSSHHSECSRCSSSTFGRSSACSPSDSIWLNDSSSELSKFLSRRWGLGSFLLRSERVTGPKNLLIVLICVLISPCLDYSLPSTVFKSTFGLFSRMINGPTTDPMFRKFMTALYYILIQ